MRKTIALLVASTAVTAAIGLPAVSAMRAQPDGAASNPFAATFADRPDALPFLLASDDDDDDAREHGRMFRHGDHDDDEGDEGDCDDDDDHDVGCAAGGSNPAPAGTVAPPQNGLFGNGAPPQVQVN